MSSGYRVELAEPHGIAAGGTTTEVADYEDVGSMYMFELSDGAMRSVGKQVVDQIEPLE
jgi:hypothetical protein